MCPYGSVAPHLRREDRPRDPKLKDSKERLPIRSLESGASTADSQIAGFGGSFGRPAAGGQKAECRVERVQLMGARRVLGRVRRFHLDPNCGKRIHTSGPGQRGIEPVHQLKPQVVVAIHRPVVGLRQDRRRERDIMVEIQKFVDIEPKSA